jgi:two-component sensor histidine kinase
MGEGLDILIVDDNPANLLALESILDDPHYHLVKAHSGQEALRLLLKRNFAAILLDVQMPGMSGFETAEIVRSLDRTRRIPIIFVTAFNKENADVLQGYSLGAVDYVFKPIVPEMLRAKVAVFVELHEKTQELLDSQRKLEQRVQERTAQLTTLNQELVQEIERRTKAEKVIEESLREKVTLLQEIHHRVKNNLQIICSLLDMQRDRVEDEKTRRILQDSESRIMAMALVHEQLYRSEDLANIDTQVFLDQLAGTLLRSYIETPGSITIEQHVHPFFLSVNTALPVALIVNELITNCLKHAFTKGGKGAIRMEFRSNEPTGYTLVVADNGIGFPQGLDLSKSKSLGMRLIKTLAEDQLEGNMEILQERGTEFRITFPALREKKGKGGGQ